MELLGTFRQKFQARNFKGFILNLNPSLFFDVFWNFPREKGPLTKMKQQLCCSSKVPRVPCITKFQSSKVPKIGGEK